MKDTPTVAIAQYDPACSCILVDPEPWTVRQAQRYYNQVRHTQQHYLIDFAMKKLNEAIRAEQLPDKANPYKTEPDTEQLNLF